MRLLFAVLAVLLLAPPAFSGGGGYCVQCHGSFELGRMEAGLRLENAAAGRACPALDEIRLEALRAERELLRAERAVSGEAGLRELSAEYRELAGRTDSMYSAGEAVSGLRAIAAKAAAMREAAEAARREARRRRLVAAGAILGSLALVAAFLGLRRLRR